MNLLFIYKNKNTQISMSIFISSINKCIIQTAVYSFHQLLKEEKKTGVLKQIVWGQRLYTVPVSKKKLQKRQNYSPVTTDVWFKGGEADTWEPWLQGHVGAFCSTECPLTSHRAHSSHAQETLCCSIGVYESTLFKWVYFLEKKSISINTSKSLCVGTVTISKTVHSKVPMSLVIYS